MIILCGRRRLVSDKFGWTIQIKKVGEAGKRKGKTRWEPDRPAYPRNLAQGLEMIHEREVKDMGEISVTELTDALKAAYVTVKEYAKKAREVA